VGHAHHLTVFYIAEICVILEKGLIVVQILNIQDVWLTLVLELWFVLLGVLEKEILNHALPALRH
jgi:hypothetical protein